MLHTFSMEESLMLFKNWTLDDFKLAAYDLLENANAELIPQGEDIRDDYYWYNAFASHGYRNNDTINAMIAWGVIHCKPSETTGNLVWTEEDSRDFYGWLANHVGDDDYYECVDVVHRAENYIDKYINEPLDYFITCEYWPTAIQLKTKARIEKEKE